MTFSKQPKNGFVKSNGVKPLQMNNTKNSGHGNDKLDDFNREEYEETPLLQAIFTYICYIVLNIFGYLRDFMRQTGIENRKGTADPNANVSWILF